MLPYPGSVVHRLAEAEICAQFPDETLDFLHLIIGEEPWPPSELKPTLVAIRTAKPQLESEPRFVALRSYLQRHGKDLD